MRHSYVTPGNGLIMTFGLPNNYISCELYISNGNEEMWAHNNCNHLYCDIRIGNRFKIIHKYVNPPKNVQFSNDKHCFYE